MSVPAPKPSTGLRKIASAVGSRKRGRRALIGAIFGAAMGILFAVLHTQGLLALFELPTVDLRTKLFQHPERVSPEVTVVEIDDPTLAELDRQGVSYPLERNWWGYLVEAIDALHPRAIVLDVTFPGHPQVDPSSPFAVPQEEIDKRESQDGAAGELFANHGHVVAAIASEGLRGSGLSVATRRTEWFTPYLASRSVPFTGPEVKVLPSDEHLLMPSRKIVLGARALGYANVAPLWDPRDAVLRRFAPAFVVPSEGDRVTCLAIGALAVALQGTAGTAGWQIDPEPAAGALPPLPSLTLEDGLARMGPYRIPLRPDHTAWVRWHGSWVKDPIRKEHVVPAWDLFRNHDSLVIDGSSKDLETAKIRDHIVLVGFTAQGDASDNVATPFGTQPGVFFHAAQLDTILTGDYLRSVPQALDVATIVLLPMIVGALAFGLQAWQGQLGGGAAMLAGWIVAAMLAFHSGWVIELVPGVLAMFFTFATSFATAFVLTLFERQEEERVKERYLQLARRGLGSDVVDKLLRDNPNAIPTLGGKRVPLTLYFSDIAGFTTISEKLAPEELVAVLNEYLGRVTDLLVNAHGAFLDKYIGDAVMAFWGAPEPSDDGPARACLAAIDAMKVMEQYSAELVARGLAPLRTRIGINTGPAVAGFIGLPDKRFYYTALGDTVNLASRLEGANKAYGTTCMIGPDTFDAAKEKIVARELDLVRVKGKKVAVRVYELMGRATDALPREREIKLRYEAALARYRARDFQAARREFQALADVMNDPPSRTMVAACDERLREPPLEGWDGSNELHEK
jgi:class 3 adenylate cyclase/CHASE2 domain-containing sensor protein